MGPHQDAPVAKPLSPARRPNPTQSAADCGFEQKICETEEGKLRLTSAELRKDGPQHERQGRGEQISFEESGNIPARDEKNANEDDLPAREGAHSPRDGGLDFAHGPHHGLDSASGPLAGHLRSEAAGPGSTIRGQSAETLIQRLRQNRGAQLRRQRSPKRKADEPYRRQIA